MFSCTSKSRFFRQSRHLDAPSPVSISTILSMYIRCKPIISMLLRRSAATQDVFWGVRSPVDNALGIKKGWHFANLFLCPKPGSNRHVFKGHWILSPTRLPIPPFGPGRQEHIPASIVCKGIQKSAIIKFFHYLRLFAGKVMTESEEGAII